MYRYEDIKEVHFEVTTKCQARCPQCPRRVPGGGRLNPFITLDEVSLDQFKRWFPNTFIKQLSKFFMCGNLGDPIIAQDTLEIFKHIRQINPEITLSMNTNGSARTLNFWKSLAELNVGVVFGIDGLEDTHHLYRVNTDWKKIIENSTAFINNGGKADWHMLVFKHNEHQIDACRDLSKELGFNWFSVKHSTRWYSHKMHVINDAGSTIHTIEPSLHSIDMYYKLEKINKDENNTISCKAVEQKQIYVSANGNVNPCCWLDLEWADHWQDTRIDYMDRIADFPNLNKIALEDIFSSGHFKRIEKTWSCSPLKECSKQCGTFDRHKQQFTEG